ncbi:MAG: hypothetical protein ACK5NG_00695 [Chthoniobacterales bacterium]
MKEILEIGLFIAGISQLLLCLGSIRIPGVLGWKEKLKPFSLLMQQLWWTYSCYILGTHLFFGILSILSSGLFFRENFEALLVSFFIALWWNTRLFLGIFILDLSEVEKTGFNQSAKWVLHSLFLFLGTVYSGIFVWNLTKLS